MKFICGYYNDQTGESTVTLANKYGQYTGYAYLHPDDKESASEYAGCNLAQKRAWLDSMRKDRRRISFQLKAIQNLYKDIKQNVKDPDPKIIKRFQIQIKLYKSALAEINGDIQELQNLIQKTIEIRDSILKRSKQNKLDK